MDYLDFLPDHSYNELPETVKASIDRLSYEERRRLVRSFGEPGKHKELPPRLAAAFGAATDSIAQEPQASQASAAAPPLKWPKAQTNIYWLAAAGWLLFLCSLGFLYREFSQETIAYAPPQPTEFPSPQVITVRDTLYLTRTEYRTRVRARIDTVYVNQPAPPPRLVYLTDTLYVAMPLADSLPELRGSQSLAGQPEWLEFLYATE